MIKSIIIINAFWIFILPSWFRNTLSNEYLYVAGISPRYYTLESSYQKARENAIDEMNKTISFIIIGEKGWLSDKDYTVYGGNDLEISWDTIYHYTDSSIIAADSIVLDSMAYYLIKFPFKYKTPIIQGKWWESMPHVDGWYISIGSFADPYQSFNGWIYSSFRARMNLADYFVKLKSLNKQSENYKQKILVEEYNVELKNSIILARHYENGIYYSLAGVPENEIYIYNKE